MSYGSYGGPRHGGGRGRRGGGGGGGPRHNHPPPERPEVKIKRAIIKFGDSDDPTPVDELSRAAEYLRDKLPADAAAVAQGFKIGICEEPHKIPYYATLLAIVSSGTLQEDSSASGAANLTRPVLEDLFKAFQSSLDALSWRDIRFFTLFFAHLTNLGMINTGSVVALLQSYAAVLDEPGVSQIRATNASRCIGEGLIRAGSSLNSSHSSAVTDLVAAIRTYHDSISDAARALYHPLPSLTLSSTPTQSEKAHELLGSLIVSLDSLAQDNWALPICIPQPETESSVIPQILRLTSEDRMDVPSVLVPPEVEGEEKVGAEETGVEWWIRMYDDELTPSPATPLGYTLRTLFVDMINIYEVNRKEGARILMEIHRWLSPGTFRLEGDREATGIILQNCLIEAVLSQLFHLPRSTLKLMYHAALINELCKLSPQTVGPAVGKSFRKMYSLLSSPDPVDDGAAGLDTRLAHLFVEWFALHMSNFGFAWVWKEWVPDLELPEYHPKRGVMRRVVDYETRLAYYDRILKTLPGPMADPEAGVVPGQAPGPTYAYEDSDHPHYQVAAGLLTMIKDRAKADEVTAHCLKLARSVPIQHMVMQALLHVGSRSFSHFLNAVERYLPLLRGEAGSDVSTSEKNKEKARIILCAAGEYWERNQQMVGVVFDKLMQYQIIEPSDVVDYAFELSAKGGGTPGLSCERWLLVEAALNKANGRVVSAKRKVATLNKQEEDRRARAIANAGGIGMDVDGDAQPAEPEMPTSQSLVSAQKALETLTKDQKKAFQSAITGFVTILTGAGVPALAPAGTWGRAEWNAWETWCWYRQFCRAYVPQLRVFTDALDVDRAGEVGGLMAKTWDTALGWES
ncbi:Nuclear cap-binding protein subunit 1 OS=Drosophila willistoni GN=Cbp80 PE=3 SV=1 [Rhizoctonia solani AG-1 IB]|uniref:Nuclear cap-binding protein subunit 1 n=1 Tax=Thanatephorus cucumeris (strain AG1-IB / isolate 7/3/14) TaxID=1108050 RepID=A0A0B7G3N2_THACB|nr:Nuclear cap-binding protein subunit 1 OS=Drosophila willistoni GN=Cbp80 PE=3 SV=1 [Rhizoctonia solani AG-1 IB]